MNRQTRGINTLDYDQVHKAEQKDCGFHIAVFFNLGLGSQWGHEASVEVL